MRSLLLIGALLAVAGAMPLPEAGTTPANAVTYEQAERVALNRAQREWPGARPGTVVPYVDESGAAAAWMFHFRVDGKPMGEYDEVADEVLAGRSGIGPNTDLRRWTSPYAHILVSARVDRAPVVRLGYGASEFYAIGRRGLEAARVRLGSSARLGRMYFVYPATYLEFTNDAGARVVYSTHFERNWQSREEFAGYVRDGLAGMVAAHGEDLPALVEYHSPAWQRELAGSYGPFVEVFVPDAGRAPFYDWSYGCTPTSAAMVMGYIDRTQDFGLIVDNTYQRHDGVEGETDYQIPNVQRECAIAMHTDTLSGGTTTNNIAPGLRQVAAENGYTWEVLGADGALWNDYCWDTIVAQIDSGRAHVWSATWEIHSLACYGYRTDDQYVYVHNTWWQPAEWWAHAPATPNWAHVGSPNPTGGDPHKLEVTYPRGDTLYNSTGRGEVVYVGDTVNVRWNNFGTPATTVAIDVSTNGGRDWTEIEPGTADDGQWEWVIQPSIPTCDSVRLRLRQYDGSTHVSGDGSFGNFRVLREPLPPQQLAPPNGLPIMNPPIVLAVDSANPRIDSIEFKVAQGVDTVWRQLGLAPSCPLPDSIFRYNRTYKWLVRGHNQYGWGPWSAVWSFRTLFGGIEESPAGQPAGSSVAGGVRRIASGSVVLAVGRPEAGTVTIYDAAGNLIAEVTAAAGRATWGLADRAGRQVGAGIYLYRSPGGRVGKFVLVD
jgi:hypothetical protein